MDDDEPVPTWQKVTGLVLLLAAVAFVVFDWGRFLSDFWPLDKTTVGPNLLASVIQWAVILIVAALLWPPTRRRIHRFVDAKADDIKQHVTAAHAKEAEDRAELHRKLDHLLTHTPGVPPLTPKPDDA